MGRVMSTREFAWQSELAIPETRDPSWVLKILIAPAAFWLGANMWSGFEQHLLRVSFLALGVLVVYACACFLALKKLWPLRGKRRRADVIARLLLVQYSSMTLVWVSVASLLVAVLAARGLPRLGVASDTIGVAWFVVIGMAAVAFAPSSLRITDKDRLRLAVRQARWLPYALGCQGLLVGTGVFLGAWLMRGSGHWGELLVGGIALLAAGLLEFFGIIAVCRFVMLATSTKLVAEADS